MLMIYANERGNVPRGILAWKLKSEFWFRGWLRVSFTGGLGLSHLTSLLQSPPIHPIMQPNHAVLLAPEGEAVKMNEMSGNYI